MESHQRDARAALDAIAEGRRRIADRVTTPPWYHPILGLCLAGFMIGPSFRSHPAVYVLIYAAAAVGMATIVQVYKQQTGVWPTLKTHGPAWSARLWFAVAIVVNYFAFAALEFLAGVPHATIGAGVVAVVLTIVFGNRFDDALRAELRGEA
jgi:hypothetical protein